VQHRFLNNGCFLEVNDKYAKVARSVQVTPKKRVSFKPNVVGNILSTILYQSVTCDRLTSSSMGRIILSSQQSFFSRAERSKNSQGKQKSRFWAWAFYLIGVPAWVIVLVSGRNWIAAAIETGGAPAVLVGPINARRGQGHAALWLDHFAKLALAIGLGLSLYDERRPHKSQSGAGTRNGFWIPNGNLSAFQRQTSWIFLADAREYYLRRSYGYSGSLAASSRTNNLPWIRV
jgi:hypothetical protein